MTSMAFKCVEIVARGRATERCCFVARAKKKQKKRAAHLTVSHRTLAEGTFETGGPH